LPNQANIPTMITECNGIAQAKTAFIANSNIQPNFLFAYLQNNNNNKQ
jgi:hypothetical protein